MPVVLQEADGRAAAAAATIESLRAALDTEVARRKELTQKGVNVDCLLIAQSALWHLALSAARFARSWRSTVFVVDTRAHAFASTAVPIR